MQNKFIKSCYQTKYGCFFGPRSEVRGMWNVVCLFRVADLILKQIFVIFDQFWRDGRVVECGGLENRCPAIAGPGVRTPLSPQSPYIKIPASVAEIYEAIVPHIIALNPSFARSALRFGTITPIPPS